MNKLLIIISLLLTSTTSYARDDYGGKAFIVLIIGIGVILYTIVEHFYHKIKFKLKTNKQKTKNTRRFLQHNFSFPINRKYLFFTLLFISLIILFNFVPYKTNYYQCNGRSLVVNKYLFNNYSMTISSENLIPHVVRKEFCKANKGSVGFVCKFQNSKEMFEAKSAREQAYIMGNMDDVKTLDDYIKTISTIKYLFRFDPITGFLRELIIDIDGEKTEHIYTCSQAENKL